MTANALPPLRLVRRPLDVREPRLDAAQARVVAHAEGPLLVLAGPGAGKTTTLVEAVVARVAAGLDPSEVLALTFSRAAAAELRERVSARLGRTTSSPTALTFHAYASALLRREAARAGEPPPVLLSGPEQDLVLRELLAGEVEDGARRWPRALRAALPTRAFAEELRDLLLRARERGWDPADLETAGIGAGRPEWVAAAHTWSDYLDRFALAPGGRRVDPASLVQEAVVLLESGPVGEEERRARRAVLVDEYQDVDPAQERLLQALAGGGRHLVAVGDPDQSVYAFRGADVSALLGFRQRFPTAQGAPAPVVSLTTCRRLRGPALAATRRLAARLPVGGLAGAVAHRSPREVEGPPTGVEVRLAPSAGAEAAVVADVLRRAHLLGVPDGPEPGAPRTRVPWGRMAVLVRSAERTLPPLRRALAAAGVPVAVSGDELPLAQEPAAAALLLALHVALPAAAPPARLPAAASPAPGDDRVWPRLDPASAAELLSGPLGGADALALRRLRRALRRGALARGDRRTGEELLAAAVREPALREGVPEAVAAPVARVAACLSAVSQAAGEGLEASLWAVWEASGLAGAWERDSRRGGEAGRQADRALDAVVALVEAASAYVDRVPGASARAFVAEQRARQVPGDSLAPAAVAPDAVRLLTAHRSKGLEWDVVVVAGVQEGVWPDLRLRGSVLGSEEVRDASDGDDAAARVRALLAEERRLFYVACTRARRSLVVTAVGGGDDVTDRPSRFLGELVPGATGAGTTVPGATGAGAESPAAEGAGPPAQVPRGLDLRSLVGELRAVVADEEAADAERDGAAARLARLSSAGVPGADPGSWWGLREPSGSAPLGAGGPPVLSPSVLEAVLGCPLRWLLTRTAGGSPPPTPSQGVGSLVHAVVAEATDPASSQVEGGAAQGGSPSPSPDPAARLAAVWPRLDLGGGPWWSASELDRARRMVDTALTWSEERAGTHTLVAVEEEFSVTDPASGAVLRGVVDRLERDDQGRAVVVDLKTGSSAPAGADVAEHPQLGAYQHAAELGAFSSRGLSGSGGAALVQVGKAAGTRGAKVQEQAPVPLPVAEGWTGAQVAQAAATVTGAEFPAVPGEACRSCPARVSCPAKADGDQVVA